MTKGESLKSKFQEAAESVATLKVSLLKARRRYRGLGRKSRITSNPYRRTMREIAIAKVKFKARVKALHAAQRRFDNLYDHIISGTPQALPGRPKTGVKRSGRTFEDCIASALAKEPERIWTLEALAERLPAIPKVSIRVLLYSLARKREAEKAGRGTWRFAASKDAP